MNTINELFTLLSKPYARMGASAAFDACHIDRGSLKRSKGDAVSTRERETSHA